MKKEGVNIGGIFGKLYKKSVGSRVPNQVQLWRCGAGFERLLPHRLYLLEKRARVSVEVTLFCLS